MSLKSLQIKLNNISDKIIENCIEAQQQTAFDIARDMYAMAPVDTGEYRESIIAEEPVIDGNKISTFIGSRYKVTTLDGKSYLLGQLLESGTMPHGIDVKRSKVLTDGVNFFGKHVEHPGTKPQPHMIPALNMNVKNYKERIKNAIKEAVK